MSDAFITTAPSVPRASGDEPQLNAKVAKAKKCSPRERG